MNLFIITLVVAFGLLLGLLAMLEAGRRLGNRRCAKEGKEASEGLGALNGSIFGLMGLLVAFTFSGAASKFDARRGLIAQEANDIGTAWLRLDLLPAATQPALREKFRAYLDERLAAYRAIPDLSAAQAHADRATALQGEIWTASVSASQADQRASMLLLPALNQMIDITTTRLMAMRTHPPAIIFILLVIVALASALLAGHGMSGRAGRSWLHMVAFAAILAFSVYVIIDIEFPRLGLIRVDSADQVLVELRQSMH